MPLWGNVRKKVFLLLILIGAHRTERHNRVSNWKIGRACVASHVDVSARIGGNCGNRVGIASIKIGRETEDGVDYQCFRRIVRAEFKSNITVGRDNEFGWYFFPRPAGLLIRHGAQKMNLGYAKVYDEIAGTSDV